ncbi:hypothetical protein JET14_09595 [Martelella lutilitoris]|uniref:Uncharacterized protein n=1 Tax=Martelella lutilitoris TaxID=2583532 RepID=A0A7T7KN12_9HYPH|nr:hypothetical protein [Martelella lutilitoris]QQM32360.1 hypothetical protein JET14_09595 [Martelella lutilitoris]
MKRAESTYLMATRARDTYAATLFGLANIATEIDNAASQGYREYRIEQQLPFDLKQTEAAQQLEKWLEEQGFRYRWRSTIMVIDPICRPPSIEYPELVIEW